MYIDASVSTHDKLFILHCFFCDSLIIRKLRSTLQPWKWRLHNLGSGNLQPLKWKSTTLEVEIYNLGSGILNLGSEDSTTLKVEYAILVIVLLLFKPYVSHLQMSQVWYMLQLVFMILFNFFFPITLLPHSLL